MVEELGNGDGSHEEASGGGISWLAGTEIGQELEKALQPEVEPVDVGDGVKTINPEDLVPEEELIEIDGPSEDDFPELDSWAERRESRIGKWFKERKNWQISIKEGFQDGSLRRLGRDITTLFIRANREEHSELMLASLLIRGLAGYGEGYYKDLAREHGDGFGLKEFWQAKSKESLGEFLKTETMVGKWKGLSDEYQALDDKDRHDAIVGGAALALLFGEGGDAIYGFAQKKFEAAGGQGEMLEGLRMMGMQVLFGFVLPRGITLAARGLKFGEEFRQLKDRGLSDSDRVLRKYEIEEKASQWTKLAIDSLSTTLTATTTAHVLGQMATGWLHQGMARINAESSGDSYWEGLFGKGKEAIVNKISGVEWLAKIMGVETSLVEDVVSDIELLIEGEAEAPEVDQAVEYTGPEDFEGKDLNTAQDQEYNKEGWEQRQADIAAEKQAEKEAVEAEAEAAAVIPTPPAEIAFVEGERPSSELITWAEDTADNRVAWNVNSDEDLEVDYRAYDFTGDNQADFFVNQEEGQPDIIKISENVFKSIDDEGNLSSVGLSVDDLKIELNIDVKGLSEETSLDSGSGRAGHMSEMPLEMRGQAQQSIIGEIDLGGEDDRPELIKVQDGAEQYWGLDLNNDNQIDVRLADDNLVMSGTGFDKKVEMIELPELGAGESFPEEWGDIKGGFWIRNPQSNTDTLIGFFENNSGHWFADRDGDVSSFSQGIGLAGKPEVEAVMLNGEVVQRVKKIEFEDGSGWEYHKIVNNEVEEWRVERGWFSQARNKTNVMLDFSESGRGLMAIQRAWADLHFEESPEEAAVKGANFLRQGVDIEDLVNQAGFVRPAPATRAEGPGEWRMVPAEDGGGELVRRGILGGDKVLGYNARWGTVGATQGVVIDGLGDSVEQVDPMNVAQWASEANSNMNESINTSLPFDQWTEDQKYEVFQSVNGGMANLSLQRVIVNDLVEDHGIKAEVAPAVARQAVNEFWSEKQIRTTDRQISFPDGFVKAPLGENFLNKVNFPQADFDTWLDDWLKQHGYK